MFSRPVKINFATGILALLFLAPAGLRAQAASATLSGTVTGATNKPVPNATVSITNLTSQKSTQTKTNANGIYSLPGLAPGKYEVTASAIALTPQTVTLRLAAGSKQTTNFALAAGLSLANLGFSPAQSQGSAREQALLNKRSHMLQIHQKLGLITFGPLLATVITSFTAHGRHSSGASRDLHIGLGTATAGLYFATAYYAIAAPGVKGVKSRGPIRFHKAMAMIHFPGMILTPILGAMAESQLNQGERLHGIAKYHGDVAIVTAVAYGLALLSVSKPGWIPGLDHHVAALFHFHHSATASASASYPGHNGRAALANNN
ncbi:MAG TPA: carboxypeptidase-like regulatory domain-containing protein [Candidatus Dormibacteraeota bacterium]|nr:carboxypeptidase-like regulatory domain-containing protein [Candidatus Dormibacteraeota bacterium]